MEKIPSEITVKGQKIALKRGRSGKSPQKMSLSYNLDGFTLRYGSKVTMKDIEEFFGRERVLKALGLSRFKPERGVLRGGSEVLFSGEKYSYRVSVYESECRLEGREVLLPVREGHSDGECGTALPTCYLPDVKELLVKELASLIIKLLPGLEEKTGLRASKVIITDAKSYWGNICPATRVMRINGKVAEKPEELIEFLLLHELIHIRYPDHGALFLKTLSRYAPDYKEKSRLLK